MQDFIVVLFVVGLVSASPSVGREDNKSEGSVEAGPDVTCTMKYLKKTIGCLKYKNSAECIKEASPQMVEWFTNFEQPWNAIAEPNSKVDDTMMNCLDSKLREIIVEVGPNIFCLLKFVNKVIDCFKNGNPAQCLTEVLFELLTCFLNFEQQRNASTE